MKRLLLIFVPLALAGAALIIFIMVNPLREALPEVFDPEVLAALPEDRQEAYITAFLSDDSASFEDSKQLVAWAFNNRRLFFEAFLREAGGRLRDMPRVLSEVSLEMIREGAGENAVALQQIARGLFPNDPHVLGALGITAFLSGNAADARRLLEQAESWRQDTPLVDFYLGAILGQSANSADRTRGKTLMMRVVNRKDHRLSEPASLALLTNPEAPVIASEFEHILGVMEEMGLLRADNPSLNADTMRILANTAIRHRSPRALELAMLLFDFPETTEEDRLAMIKLAQLTGETAIAAKTLAELEDKGLADPANTPWLARLQAIQHMLEERHEEGLAQFRELAETQPDEPGVQEAFRMVLQRRNMPMSLERELLETYLRLPVINVPLSLAVLSRLMEIAPLQQKNWTGYVARELLPRETGLSARWLAIFDQSDKVIEVLAPKRPEAGTDETIALTEAYLAADRLDEARELLKESGETVGAALFEYFHSRIALQAGDKETAFERWMAAQNAAIGSSAFPLLQNLGFLALELEQPVNALQSLYTAFSAGIAFNRQQLGQLMNLTLSHGSLAQTIRVAESLRDQHPEEPVHRNNLAYFRFLAQEDLENSVEVMRQLVDDYPDVNQYRLTLALGLLRQGRNNEAKRLLDSTQIDWQRTSNRGQMIYAAVLAANEQRVVASGLIQNIKLDELIPEERALLGTN